MTPAGMAQDHCKVDFKIETYPKEVAASNFGARTSDWLPLLN